MVRSNLLFIFLLLSVFTMNAQNMYLPGNAEIATLPYWAQEMYSENPNILVVDSAYYTYYKDHHFEKNYHTQYYKKWRRFIGDRIDPNGYEIKLTLKEKAEKVLYNRHMQNRSAGWNVLGPVVSRNTSGDTVAQQSNIYCIDRSNSNPDVWYCGTETGEVYRSNNSGMFWNNISLNQNFDGGVTAIEVDPVNADVVYAGSGAFVLKSENGGVDWNIVLSLSGLQPNEIMVHPGGGDTVLVAGNLGLYRSIDGGANWNTIYSGRCYDVKPNVANGDIFYLVKRNSAQNLCEFFISTDAGQTFTQQTSGWHTSSDAGRNDGGARLAVTEADPNRIYAYLIGESKTGDTGYIGVYRSDDGGYSWSLPNGPAGGPYDNAHMNLAIGTPDWQYHQGFYNCAILASNSNPNHILVGGLNLYKSTDAGATFFPIAGYVGGSYSIHVDMQDFRIFGNTTIISTDGGIYRSDDFFETGSFSVRMAGIHASDYWGFGQGWNTDVFVGGLYHNGNLAFHENYGAGNFLQLGGGEPASGYVNPGENRRVYSSDINGAILPLNIGDPVVWTGFGIDPNESYWEAESTELEFLPFCYRHAITGYKNELWKTVDGGSSFSKWAQFGTNENDRITYIEISRSNPQVIYVCQQIASPANGVLWKTDDNGNTWSSIALPISGYTSKKMLIQLDPTDDNKLWIAFANGSNSTKVYRTEDGGLSWINITTAELSGQRIQSLVLIPNTNGGVYAFSNNGVWYRNNTSSAWTDFSNGLPTTISTNIARPFYRDGKIRLASYGRGIWEAQLTEEPSAPVAQIGVDQPSLIQHCTADTLHFVDQSIINHTNAQWQWQFPGGMPSSDTGLYPGVVYNSPGDYMVYLSVTDSAGNSDIDSLLITIEGYVAGQFIAEEFESIFPPVRFEIVNPDEGATWEQNTNCGGFGESAQCAWFNNYDYYPGGAEDDLRISIDFTNPADTWLYFDVAYARYAVNYSDSLEVLISTDCGQSFQQVYYRGGSDLATAPDNSEAFIPTASQWRTDSVDMAAYTGENEVMIVFRNHSGWGNNTYLDNINLAQNILSINSPPLTDAGIQLYPNPAPAGGNVFCTGEYPSELSVYDLSGKKIYHSERTDWSFNLPVLACGSYVYILTNDYTIKRGTLIIK